MSGISARTVVPDPWRRVDPQRAAEERRALAHPDQPESLPHELRLEADAVVLDLDLDVAADARTVSSARRAIECLETLLSASWTSR